MNYEIKLREENKYTELEIQKKVNEYLFYKDIYKKISYFIIFSGIFYLYYR